MSLSKKANRERMKLLRHPMPAVSLNTMVITGFVQPVCNPESQAKAIRVLQDNGRKKKAREAMRLLIEAERKELGSKCEVCGFSLTLDIHHEGENRDKHLLCPNCHALITRRIKTLAELMKKTRPVPFPSDPTLKQRKEWEEYRTKLRKG